MFLQFYFRLNWSLKINKFQYLLTFSNFLVNFFIIFSVLWFWHLVEPQPRITQKFPSRSIRDIFTCRLVNGRHYHDKERYILVFFFTPLCSFKINKKNNFFIAARKWPVFWAFKFGKDYIFFYLQNLEWDKIQRRCW